MSLTSNQFGRVCACFADGRGRDRAGRESLLRERFAQETELAEQVRQMWAADALPDLDVPTTDERTTSAWLAEILDTAPTAPPVALARGLRVGKHEIVRLLGRGGAGVVYEARSENPRRRVALKILDPAADADLTDRFRLEGELLARLEHPGIARVYESGRAETEAGPLRYIAMEFVRGTSLLAHADAARADRAQRLGWLIDIARAVTHAHANGIIHRDLKPENILIDEAAVPRLVDFGIAKDEEADRRTQHGDIRGTLSYMSPEQLRGEGVDARSDVFSLGVVGSELLLGTHPYAKPTGAVGETVAAILAGRQTRTASDESRRSDLARVLSHAVEADASRRYASMQDFADDLQAVADKRPVTVRSPSLAYRTGRLLRRHPVVSAVVTAFAIGILASLALALDSAHEASAQRHLAEQEAQAAAHAEAASTREATRARRAARATALTLALMDTQAEQRVENLRALDAMPPSQRDWAWNAVMAWLDTSAAHVPFPDTGRAHLFVYEGGLDLRLATPQEHADHAPPNEPGGRWAGLLTPGDTKPSWTRLDRASRPDPAWLSWRSQGLYMETHATGWVGPLENLDRWPHVAIRGKEIACLITRPHFIDVFRATDGTHLQRLDGNKAHDANHIALDRGEDRVFIARHSGEIIVRLAAHPTVLASSYGHRGPVHMIRAVRPEHPLVRPSSQALCFVSIGEDGARLFLPHTPTRTVHLRVHGKRGTTTRSEPLAMASAPHGPLLSVVQANGGLAFLHARSKIAGGALHLADHLESADVLWSQDGNTVWVAAYELKPGQTEQAGARIWEVDAWRGVARRRVPVSGSRSPRLTRGARDSLLALTADGQLLTLREGQALEPKPTGGTPLVVGPGALLVRHADGTYTCEVLETETNIILSGLEGKRPTAVAARPGGQGVLVGFERGAIGVWGPAGGAPLHMHELRADPITILCVHPSEPWFVASGGSGNLALLDLVAGDLICRIPRRGEQAPGLAFSPDGQELYRPHGPHSMHVFPGDATPWHVRRARDSDRDLAARAFLSRHKNTNVDARDLARMADQASQGDAHLRTWLQFHMLMHGLVRR